ncbi:MAG: hypothetical protein IKP21_03135 [Bacteroidales bacterium]|nr:hypothetical protein [Bacteroidales bacterium]
MKKLTIIIGLLAAMGCLAGEAMGQAVATLSADTIALGDQTTLSIRRALNYPSTDMLTTDGIVAVSQTFDTATQTQHTVLTSFEPGEHAIHLSPTDSLMLVVTDVEIDTTTAEIRDIAPLQRVPYTFWEIFRWVLLGLVVAAIAFGVWWLLKHREKVHELLVPAETKDTRTPHERATDNLEALRRQQLWQAGKAKEYHTELTDIVRRFIEEATDIRATDMTSDETVEAVESGKWKVVIALLRNIFTTADLVKFAKSEPLPYEHDRSMTEARQFVDELWEAVKPKEEEAPHE